MKDKTDKTDIVLKLISEVKDLLEKDSYIGALALSLMLPDVCGKAESPNEKGNKARYTFWYDTYIGRYEKARAKSDDPEFRDRPYLSGEVVYYLRCSFLHEGLCAVDDSSISNPQNKSVEFHLVIPKKEFLACLRTETNITYNQDGSVVSCEYFIDIPYLCSLICNVAEQYYWNNQASITALKKNVNIIDERVADEEDDELDE